MCVYYDKFLEVVQSLSDKLRKRKKKKIKDHTVPNRAWDLLIIILEEEQVGTIRSACVYPRIWRFTPEHRWHSVCSTR